MIYSGQHLPFIRGSGPAISSYSKHLLPSLYRRVLGNLLHHTGAYLSRVSPPHGTAESRWQH